MSDRPWSEGGIEKPYSVTLWDTDPNLGEDTCCVGDDFATIEEANNAFNDIESCFSGLSKGYYKNTPYVLMDGPGVWQVRKRPGVENSKSDDSDDSYDRHEFAMQQGMAFGVDAYNEAMGYD